MMSREQIDSWTPIAPLLVSEILRWKRRAEAAEANALSAPAALARLIARVEAETWEKAEELAVEVTYRHGNDDTDQGRAISRECDRRADEARKRAEEAK